jgi:hypothetical protein
MSAEHDLNTEITGAADEATTEEPRRGDTETNGDLEFEEFNLDDIEVIESKVFG